MNIFFIMIFSFSLYSQDFVFDKEKGRALPSYIGQVKLIKGKVFKKNQEGMTEVSAGERFRKNDTVITQDKSFVRIQIADDTILSLGPKTELSFDDFDFKDKMDRKLSFTLLKGQITGDIKNKAGPEDIKFKTRYTSMGVRGTYLLLNHQTLNSLNIAEYALLSGKIEIQNHNGKRIPLQKGERVVLIHDDSRNISANDKAIMTSELFKDLEASSVAEDEFKPFLPYFSLQDASSTSPLYQILNTSESPQATPSNAVSKKRREKSFTLEEKLQQLNQKLKSHRR